MKQAALITLVLFLLASSALSGQSSGWASVSAVPFGRALQDAETLTQTNPTWQVARVKGQSMEPFFGSNSLVVYRPVAPSEIAPGMIVVFTDSAGDMVVHQIISEESGAIRTKGFRNFRADPDILTPAQIHGAVVAVFHSRGSSEELVLNSRGQPLPYALGKAH